MPFFICLLRGINVGGNKIIRMADLKQGFEEAGFEQVHTLLQSGNVVFQSPETDLALLTRQIEAIIIEGFGFESKIILLTQQALQAVVTQHPFPPEQIAEPSKILVTFLLNHADPDAVVALQSSIKGPESILGAGKTLYIFYPNGMGRSKLDNNLIQRSLNTVSTGRNWNTVNKLLALSQGL